MKRNSTTIWIETFGTTTPLPWVNGAPNFSDFNEPTLSILITGYEDNKDNIVVIPDVVLALVAPEADWKGLLNSLFVGDLAPIFQDVTMVAANSTNNALVLARGDIFGAITSVKQEIALAAALGLLVSSGYVVSSKNKTLWNNTVTSFNFSPLVFL